MLGLIQLLDQISSKGPQQLAMWFRIVQ